MGALQPEWTEQELNLNNPGARLFQGPMTSAKGLDSILSKSRAEGAGVEPARPFEGSTGFQPGPVAHRVALPNIQ